MKELVLPLKKKWFEMIKSGVKLEEYREISEFWVKRFCKNRKTMFCWCANGNCNCNEKANVCFHSRELEWDSVTFTCGYPKKGDLERRITFANPSIRIGQGKEEWGAEDGKKYFVITWQMQN